jgi:hypothetical protein
MPNVAFFKRLLHSQKVREDTDLLTDIFASVRKLSDREWLVKGKKYALMGLLICTLQAFSFYTKTISVSCPMAMSHVGRAMT